MRLLVFQIVVLSIFLFSCASNKELAKLKDELEQRDKAQNNMAVKLTEALKENNENKIKL